MLQAAIENEVIDYIQAHRDRRDENGRRLVVRNGHLPQREVVTGIGPVQVRQPRVRHRETGKRFSSAILRALRSIQHRPLNVANSIFIVRNQRRLRGHSKRLPLLLTQRSCRPGQGGFSAWSVYSSASYPPLRFLIPRAVFASAVFAVMAILARRTIIIAGASACK